MPPQPRPLVRQEGDDGLVSGGLAGQGQVDQHEEEEEAPELRHGHLQHGGRVRDEGQRHSAFDNLKDSTN